MELFEKTRSIWLTQVHMALFAAMSPAGILIVIATQESVVSEDSSPVLILLSAVATGTILYIVFFEILQRSHKDREPKCFGLLLIVCMLTGFAAMTCLTLYIQH